MLFTYKDIVNNLNIYNVLIMEKTVYIPYTKIIELTNLGAIKKKANILLFKENFENDEVVEEKLNMYNFLNR